MSEQRKMILYVEPPDLQKALSGLWSSILCRCDVKASPHLYYHTASFSVVQAQTTITASFQVNKYRYFPPAMWVLIPFVLLDIFDAPEYLNHQLYNFIEINQLQITYC